jgi:hypothetical protein
VHKNGQLGNAVICRLAAGGFKVNNSVQGQRYFG